MGQFRRLVLWISLSLIALLFIFSVYGAFLNAAPAREFFNSLPLTVYWSAFIVFLLIGIVVFRRLLRVPGLLAMHLGCILVFLGGMWGSPAGHRLWGREKLPSGRIQIYEGLSENRLVEDDALLAYLPDPNNHIVIAETNERGRVVFRDDDTPVLLDVEDPRLFRLPFEIHLKDFSIEYYDPPVPVLYIETDSDQAWQIRPVLEGAEYQLEDQGTVRILGVFRNFKLARENGAMVPYDDPDPGSNPAVWVRFTLPDGSQKDQFAFAQFPGHSRDNQAFHLTYQIEKGMIKDYFSDLQVLQDGKVVLEKKIQVNDPLHYGGYHFYQSSYDARNESYTILSVTSDSGLWFVWIGYILLACGLIWHQWIVPAQRHFSQRRAAHGR
ncbi:MAG: cytochrome c biogenesis protein ResB [Sedimentisphaerales bacterium]|nr:cytochrome c biogenesis protein ResB [Sedimentisphaerales bacterium]